MCQELGLGDVLRRAGLSPPGSTQSHFPSSQLPCARTRVPSLFFSFFFFFFFAFFQPLTLASYSPGLCLLFYHHGQCLAMAARLVEPKFEQCHTPGVMYTLESEASKRNISPVRGIRKKKLENPGTLCSQASWRPLLLRWRRLTARSWNTGLLRRVIDLTSRGQK
jgi:hypothetical protein